MAKMKILGNSLTIISDVKYDDIAKVVAVAPDFTRLLRTSEVPPYDVETVFAVGVTSGVGSITNSGVCFDSKDANGKAYLTLAIERDEKMDEKYFADQYMTPMVRLNEVELRIKEAIEYVNETVATVTKDITIIG